jgi:hypothetical protein
MKKQIYIAFAILIVLGFAGSVLAFWPFTGKVITGYAADGTAMSDSPQTCMDSDGGIFALIPGSVTDVVKNKIYIDSCSGSNIASFKDVHNNDVKGKSAIIEYYCDADGKVQSRKMTSNELGAGACILSTDSSTKGKAFWKTKEEFCKAIWGGAFDENGNTWVPGCGKDSDKDNLISSYTCDTNNNAVPASLFDCKKEGYLGGCEEKDNKISDSKDACVGKCVDTDSDNNKDNGGIVTVYTKTLTDVKEKTYADRCSADKKSIKQYKCNAVGSIIDLGFASCGANKECVNDATGAYCKNKNTVNSINDRVTTLEGLVVSLSQRVAKLECKANPNEPTNECCEYYPETPGCTAE